jgi:hypothetical protein
MRAIRNNVRVEVRVYQKGLHTKDIRGRVVSCTGGLVRILEDGQVRPVTYGRKQVRPFA